MIFSPGRGDKLHVGWLCDDVIKMKQATLKKFYFIYDSELTNHLLCEVLILKTPYRCTSEQKLKAKN